MTAEDVVGGVGAEPDETGTEPGAAGTELGAAGTEPGGGGTEPGAAGTEPRGGGTEPGAAEIGPDDEDGVPGRTIARLTDPRALRAYAHPIRMKLMGLLRTEGPLTATSAAELLGESSGTCSFHLRQLAKYGLVEEAGGGTGRQKPWRATTTSTGWDAVAKTPEAAAATGLLNTIVAEEYFDQLMRWLEASPNEPEEWQDAVQLGDRLLYVTADELAELGREVRELVDVYFERQLKPELRPAGARLVTYLHLAFPDVNPRRTGRQ
ncbi:MAG TPA: helix-turn-helix domain-containing protein [Streptosporangiaceae bacterium]|nr:helix-turn-helix domain-containing protein [Streptosporangiaceae bacterium]